VSARILELVANFSEGRDHSVVRALADAMREAGADVLDWTADADHHRCVITAVGRPAQVEDAAVAAAFVAERKIDMRRHDGLHPRIGAVDVVPFVPLLGLTMAEAVSSARRVARRFADEVGIPAFHYALASEPPGRRLSELRRGGFEAIVGGWPETRQPDTLPDDWPHAGAHPTAGASCVGARNVLLAWNVFVDGVALDTLKQIARSIRETGGGIRGLRALAFRFERTGAHQISMNLENVENEGSPVDVFRRIEDMVASAGGRIERTEVIGLTPDRLVLDAAMDRLKLESSATERQLSKKLLSHLAGMSDGE
jgi:glutamate formiminotransferase / 5-formyltetrahydrofolate cyclo-ligase